MKDFVYATGLFRIARSFFRCTAALFFLLPAIAVSAQEKRGVNVGIVYPLSTRGHHAGEHENFFSLHTIAGVSRREHAFTAAGISNIVHENARGFQIAGVSNHIGGFSEGFKAAGILNLYHGAHGFQVAGFTNIARENVTGMQAAGFMNMARDFRGFQVAGFFNKAQTVQGTQAAGYINIAEDVHGAQLAGFVNIARNVKGVQIAGLINIADSSEYPIGIINIIKNGEKWIGISTDDNLTTLVTFRSGSKKLYGIFGLGYNFENDKHVFARQFGIGAHFINTGKFRLNTEITATALENFRKGEFDKFSLSLLPSLKIGPRLELFGGPSLSLINTDTVEGKKVVDHFIWHDTNGNNKLNGLYIGYSAGIQMSL